MDTGIKIHYLKSPEDIADILSRRTPVPEKVTEKVKKIIDDIKNVGTEKLLEYTERLDGFKASRIEELKVDSQDIKSSFDFIKNNQPGLADAIDSSMKNIRKFHEEQKKSQRWYWSIEKGPAGGTAQRIDPVERAGLYIPGGRFPYPSTVLMTAVPAQVAGVESIAVFTPPGAEGIINDVILYTVWRCGLKEVYKIGGAQAVAVMAYGLPSIKKVDKIAGPGNIYVTAAKKLVYGDVGIDSLAGPSEVLIIADDSADPDYIASDLISQAEHDPDASVILLTDNLKTAKDTLASLGKNLDRLSEKYPDRFDIDMVLSTISKKCKLIYGNMEMLIKVSNMIAPEHLEIMVKDTEHILGNIKNAGAIFIGDYSPVAVGDYYAGTNHVIPTSGNARFASPLGVFDFVKRTSITYFDKNRLSDARKYIEVFSDTENLLAHRESVEKRFKGEPEDES